MYPEVEEVPRRDRHILPDQLLQQPVFEFLFELSVPGVACEVSLFVRIALKVEQLFAVAIGIVRVAILGCPHAARPGPNR